MNPFDFEHLSNQEQLPSTEFPPGQMLPYEMWDILHTGQQDLIRWHNALLEDSMDTDCAEIPEPSWAPDEGTAPVRYGRDMDTWKFWELPEDAIHWGFHVVYEDLCGGELEHFPCVGDYIQALSRRCTVASSVWNCNQQSPSALYATVVTCLMRQGMLLALVPKMTFAGALVDSGISVLQITAVDDRDMVVDDFQDLAGKQKRLPQTQWSQMTMALLEVYK